MYLPVPQHRSISGPTATLRRSASLAVPSVPPVPPVPPVPHRPVEDAEPPLTLEWLVARDIDAFSRRRGAAVLPV